MVDFVSLHEKIKCGMAFRKHVEIAISLDPSDALAYHLLGRWCFEVRAWYVRGLRREPS